eukprot:13720550-Alexandrium_andersonii.AAC.1
MPPRGVPALAKVLEGPGHARPQSMEATPSFAAAPTHFRPTQGTQQVSSSCEGQVGPQAHGGLCAVVRDAVHVHAHWVHYFVGGCIDDCWIVGVGCWELSGLKGPLKLSCWLRVPGELAAQGLQWCLDCNVRPRPCGICTNPDGHRQLVEGVRRCHPDDLVELSTKFAALCIWANCQLRHLASSSRLA